MDHELMTGWLSVDPMSDKYPSISPYAYCAWNPVKLVDPDGMEAEDDWVKNKKTSQYEWNKNATSPENTPYGYKYVGDDYALLRELNIRTNYDIKEDCMTGISPSMSSTHVGFTRSRACISATIIVRVCVREDIENVTSDNPSGETFDGINIIGYTNQWSRSGNMEPNGIIYNGYLAIEGSGVFFRQSPFAIPSTDTYSPSGTVPMTATVHIPANMYITIF